MLTSPSQRLNELTAPPGCQIQGSWAHRSRTHVAITTANAGIISNYIEMNRPDVEDQQGRNLLLSTSHCRLSKPTFRRYIYSWSRPCKTGAECPYNRVVEDCEAAQSMDTASSCPSSRSPHALRHGYSSTDCETESQSTYSAIGVTLANQSSRKSTTRQPKRNGATFAKKS